MTALLCVVLALHLLGILATLRTVPGAPRKPEPSAATLMVVLLIHAGMVAWCLWLLLSAGGQS